MPLWRSQTAMAPFISSLETRSPISLSSPAGSECCFEKKYRRSRTMPTETIDSNSSAYIAGPPRLRKSTNDWKKPIRVKSPQKWFANDACTWNAPSVNKEGGRVRPSRWRNGLHALFGDSLLESTPTMRWVEQPILCPYEPGEFDWFVVWLRPEPVMRLLSFPLSVMNCWLVAFMPTWSFLALKRSKALRNAELAGSF